MTCYGVEDVLGAVLLAVLPGSAIATLGLQVARKKLGLQYQPGLLRYSRGES